MTLNNPEDNQLLHLFGNYVKLYHILNNDQVVSVTGEGVIVIDVNPDIVCRLIELAREFHAQEEVVFPEIKGNPSGDWATQTLANHADDMTFLEFRSIIQDLEPDQQQQVVALLWMGRGDFSLDEWEDVLGQAADDWTPYTAEYLIVHPFLADFLMEGLDLFGYSCD